MFIKCVRSPAQKRKESLCKFIEIFYRLLQNYLHVALGACFMTSKRSFIFVHVQSRTKESLVCAFFPIMLWGWLNESRHKRQGLSNCCLTCINNMELLSEADVSSLHFSEFISLFDAFFPEPLAAVKRCNRI